MSLVKPPRPDPTLDPFRDGTGVLTEDGKVIGHVATELSSFWSPLSPLRRQWWVWLIVVWADGTRERSVEDYPPWSYVAEMKSGRFIWATSKPGKEYDFTWLPKAEALRVRAELDIRPGDF